jgi:hypothetical protein
MLIRKATNLKNSSPYKVFRTSSGLKSPEMLTEEEDNRIDSNKIVNRRNIITDINSDVDNLSVKSEISDCTSMSSNSNTLNLFSDSELSTPKSTRKSDSDRKRKYQEFVKIMLKVKFEKIHNTHKGQEISEKDLFAECERQGVEPNKWREFIIDVLKDPRKCQEILGTSSRRKSRIFSPKMMETIKEEN